jgi:SAM-dependent methyltransferase
MSNARLLSDFVAAYPAQPATAYWRAIEIGALVRLGLPEGLGLDLGCGDGILTDILLRHAGARQLVGVDLDPLETKAAEKFPFYSRLHVAPGNAIPEQSGAFDFVLANSVLEHIPGLDGTVAESSRLLRRGGRFLFTVPGPAFHANLRGPLWPGVERSTYLETLDRRIVHYHYLSVADWEATAARHGMVLDGCFGYFDASETKRWETLSRMTGGLFYSLLGETRRPIEIQRRLGIRDIQNKGGLPGALAGTIASVISLGAPVDRNEYHWLDANGASCLLVHGRKV